MERSGAGGLASMDTDRRQHRRLDIRLPLDCVPVDNGSDRAFRSTTRNISTGGLYFETDLADRALLPREHSLVNIELTVPPGQGHFPYQGQVSSVAEVLRHEPLETPASAVPNGSARFGVAVRFREPLKLKF